jgi:hypothetical protein
MERWERDVEDQSKQQDDAMLQLKEKAGATSLLALL